MFAAKPMSASDPAVPCRSSVAGRVVTGLRHSALPCCGARTMLPDGPAVETCTCTGAFMLATADGSRASTIRQRAAELQTAMQRGFVDLYAGGTRSIDSLSAARCLMVLARRPSAVASMNAPVKVQVSTAGPSGSIVLAPQQGSAEWRSPVTTLPATLDLHGTAGSEALIGFAANIDYSIDGRRAAAAAVGFGLQRRYSVLRDHAWKDIPAGAVRAGDWVRVELALDSSATRRYVAISDTEAGGLRPADLALSGVAGVDVRRLSDSGSPYFSERKVDDRYARFYCDELPPGHHEIFYYARATHAGHYTAMPAVAELMYGPATVARTAATSIEIAPGGE